MTSGERNAPDLAHEPKEETITLANFMPVKCMTEEEIESFIKNMEGTPVTINHDATERVGRIVSVQASGNQISATVLVEKDHTTFQEYLVQERLKKMNLHDEK